MANVNKRGGRTMHAEIAGAGFAGLTTAVALRQRAVALREIANIKLEKGDNKAALDALHSAQAILGRLAAARPGDYDVAAEQGQVAFLFGAIAYQQRDLDHAPRAQGDQQPQARDEPWGSSTDPCKGQHPQQHEDLRERHDDHRQGGRHGDRCDGALRESDCGLPHRGFVVQSLQADAHHGTYVGDHGHDGRGKGKCQPLVDIEPVRAAQDRVARVATSRLTWGEGRARIDRVAVLAGNQVGESPHRAAL